MKTTPRIRLQTAAIFLTAGLVAAACDRGPSGGNQAEKATTFVHIHGLAVDPSDPDRLLVATHRGLIQGTKDANWTYTSTDRTDHMGFTLDPRTGTLLRSGHPEAGGNLGVETSTEGRNWRELSDVLSPPVDFHAMALSFADPKTMYGWDSGGRGLFRSTDGGGTWEVLSPQGLPAQIFALAAPGQAGAVLAGAREGLFRSDDAGATWRRIAEGPVSAIAADPKDPKHLLAFVGQGVQISRDGGASWDKASAGLPAGDFVGALTVSSHDGEVAYAAGATSIFKTTDGGKSWSLIRSGE